MHTYRLWLIRYIGAVRIESSHGLFPSIEAAMAYARDINLSVLDSWKIVEEIQDASR